MAGEPTIEFHGDLVLFLKVHDCIGVIVRLPDHYLSVQLRTSSWGKQQRAQLDNQWDCLSNQAL